jgi:hypothetical protein
MDEAAWTSAMAATAASCASVEAKLCTVIVPKYVNSETGERVLCPEIVRDAWKATGYRMHDVAYATKGIQAARDGRIAALNNRAKRMRVPLSDMLEVLTFRRG